jgi:NAD dependent epimerase/dehydratase family enzyme
MTQDRASKILLTSGSGLIGKALREQLSLRDLQYLQAMRKPASSTSRSEVLWDPERAQPFEPRIASKARMWRSISRVRIF